MKNNVTFIVEKTMTKMPRRPQMSKDGSLLVYVTRKYRDVFMFVAGSILELQTQPSYQEIADACDYGIRSSALRAVRAVAEYGLLTTDAWRARSIKVTDVGRKVYFQWKGKRRVKA